MPREKDKFLFNKKDLSLYERNFDANGKETKPTKLSEGFYPKNLHRDIDTDETSMGLKTIFHGKRILRYVTLDKLQPSKLADLAKYGYPFIDAYNRRLISRFLDSQVKTLPMVEVTKGLGWKELEGKQFFQLQDSISVNNDVNVKYVGDILVKSAGTYEEYVDILNKHVFPYIQTQVMVAFSTSSALASYIDPELNFILHMNSQTTSGKTTMLGLSSSVWGSPERRNNGIHQTWNATHNAVLNSLCGVNSGKKMHENPV